MLVRAIGTAGFTRGAVVATSLDIATSDVDKIDGTGRRLRSRTRPSAPPAIIKVASPLSGVT